MDGVFKFTDRENMLSGIDLDKLTADPRWGIGHEPQISTEDFLLDGLGIDTEQIKDKNLFLRNYIYTIVSVQKDLIEIRERLAKIQTRMSKVCDDSYEVRKLKYFKELNYSAEKQIVKFLTKGLNNYLVGQYSDFIDGKGKNDWLFGPRYDYHYNSKFYDPDYDFSTWVKFYEVPNVNLFERVKNIEECIKLKAEDIEQYNTKIVALVDKEDLMKSMAYRIGSNYHLHARKEIFESMTKLFEEEQYLSFIAMAIVQLEGVFYDLVSIKYGKKEKQGTLIEKVEKAFRENPTLKRSLYPYFAYDVPELRNAIAHKGIISDDDIKQSAYNLILDLNCIVTLTEKSSEEKLAVFLAIAEELNKIKKEDYSTTVEYRLKIAEQLLEELFKSNLFRYDYFWELLFTPEDYEEEIEYYRPDDVEDDFYLKNVIYAISNICKSKVFWEIILKECNDLGSGNHDDFLQLIIKLTNNLINKLDREEKQLCIEVKKKIKDL